MLLPSLFLNRPWCRHLCPPHRNTTEGLFDNTRRIVRTTHLIEDTFTTVRPESGP